MAQRHRYFVVTAVVPACSYAGDRLRLSGSASRSGGFTSRGVRRGGRPTRRLL